MAAAQVLRQPDISYHPDFTSYQLRSQYRQKTEKLPATIPSGFPQQISSPLVWEGKDVEASKDWIVQLNGAQLNEIDEALKHFKCTWIALNSLTQKTHH